MSPLAGERADGSGVPGLVVWVTGLPCSGKTTLARALTARIREVDPRCVLLDGDALRSTIADDLGYATDDRRRAAWRYARLAALLATQELHVVVATVSMFEDVRRWSRARLERYVEVYLCAAEHVRRARDHAGLLRRAGVVGADQPFEEPAAPDVVVHDRGRLAPAEVLALVWPDVVGRLRPQERERGRP